MKAYILPYNGKIYGTLYSSLKELERDMDDEKFVFEVEVKMIKKLKKTERWEAVAN